jgi:predicted metal-dependent peptidase
MPVRKKRTPRELIEIAKMRLVYTVPFFSTLLMRLKVEEADPKECKTMQTDMVRLQYNPEWIDRFIATPKELMAILCHEVLHCALLHNLRRGGRDPLLWNVACDYAVNLILNGEIQRLNGQISWPVALLGIGDDGKTQTDFLLDSQYKDMSAEEIYEKLKKNCLTAKQLLQMLGNAPQDVMPAGKTAKNQDEKDQANGEQWKMAVSMAAQTAKRQGNLPAGFARELGELLNPQLPWKDMLRAFMTSKTADDYTWTRGNRHFIAQGLYLPSMKENPAMGYIAVCIDTSGSIGDNELREFWSELDAIVQDTSPERVRVMWVDSEIAKDESFGRGEELVCEPAGGGGTDFKPPFERIEKEGEYPRCLVYLTDGYGDFPDEEPPYPTFWVINNKDVKPPFGEHCTIIAES